MWNQFVPLRKKKEKNKSISIKKQLKKNEAIFIEDMLLTINDKKSDQIKKKKKKN